MLKWSLRHLLLCNSLSSVSDNGKDLNGTSPTVVNISASPCLSLLIFICVPLAPRWAIMRSNKKATVTETDLQSLILHAVSETEAVWVICPLASPAVCHSSGIFWAASCRWTWDTVHYTSCFPQISALSASKVTKHSHKNMVCSWSVLLPVILWWLIKLSQILDTCRGK